MSSEEKKEYLEIILKHANVHNVIFEFSGEMTMNMGGEKHKDEEKPKVNDEIIARALMALNGKDNVIDSQRAWLGACLLLGWKYKFPRNLADCCKKVSQLPINMECIEYPCIYNSIRMFGSWKFVKENYDNWATLTPRDDEKPIFEKSLSVAQALDKEIEYQLENALGND